MARTRFAETRGYKVLISCNRMSNAFIYLSAALNCGVILRSVWPCASRDARLCDRHCETNFSTAAALCSGAKCAYLKVIRMSL
jgi:hypothetical protein